MSYKWCVVPQCKNTSIRNPEKVFVSVPTNAKRRIKWLKLARRDPESISSHTNVFMCEDHFDMEKDTINYMQYKMGFSKKILLTDEAMPKKFQCQEDRKSRLCDPEHPRDVFTKRRRMDLLEECEKEICLPSENSMVSTFEKDINMPQDIINPDEDSTMAESTISEVSLNAPIVQVDVHECHSELSASITTTNNVRVTENQPTNDPLSIDRVYPKTAAERMKEYRARKKKENGTVNYPKRKKSGAERVQEYRARKKAKIESANSTMAESAFSEESSQTLIVEVDGRHGHGSYLGASSATTSNVSVIEHQPTSDLPSIVCGYPKTAAERMREYRARKNKENPIVNHRKPKESDTECAQEYRAKKNAKVQSAEPTRFVGNQLPEAYEDIVITPYILGDTLDSETLDDEEIDFKYESSENKD